jgi:2-keto-4-pentenoate hydratase/2-oxohepta-3-ene-1,7-dioic acid hydratase in catechol pathway
MRLGTVRIHGGAPRAVGNVDGHIIDLSEAAFGLGLVGTPFPASVRQLLELKPYTDPLIADLENAVSEFDDIGSAPWAYTLDDVTFESPVAPGKVLLVGGNRKGSATVPLQPEIQDEWPRPMYFMKPGSSALGHGGTVNAWQVMRPVHTEGEVCLIIWRRATHVAAADAWSYVAGVSLLNDMFAGRFVLQDGTKLSIRTAVGQPNEEMITRQMVRSKSPDGMCPIGPWLVPVSDLGRPFEDIGVVTKVGPNTVQVGTISDYEFTAEACIEEITKWITLEPGDVVSLGCFAHQPDFPLRSVDLAAPQNRVVTITADELGSLETKLHVVDEPK